MVTWVLRSLDLWTSQRETPRTSEAGFLLRLLEIEPLRELTDA